MTSNKTSPDEATEVRIISSLRFDPDLPSAVAQYPSQGYPEPHDSPYYLLRYHRERLLKAAVEFRWPDAIEFLQKDLAHFTQALDSFIPDRTKAWRLRLVINHQGRLCVDVHPAAIWPLQCMFIPASFGTHISLSQTFPWRLVVDTERTKPSLLTAHKTTSRDHYNAARERVGISSPADPVEVLLVNTQGEAMEGSITTVYFQERSSSDYGNKSNAQWITPPLSSGGMISASRSYALDQGFCTEQVIRVGELVHGEQCFLSNAVRGFIPAIVNLDVIKS
ncbi:aminotransferase [Talaromyces proteolyticus]|uniref:Aminotransferase n=1 Tax=Talaromyces proteolyticus TaxID=1131652 RepID=A0AAD4PYD8_9EURO|nr:aminotransferase [Talaromyces proteolyticus]KAH8694164.1 aminotransferase [Talaromyces proteolyticus]